MKEVVIYPTSIVAPGSSLEPVREAKIQFSSTQIEVLHILCFFAIMYAILGSSFLAIKKIAQKERQSQPYAHQHREVSQLSSADA